MKKYKKPELMKKENAIAAVKACCQMFHSDQCKKHPGWQYMRN